MFSRLCLVGLIILCLLPISAHIVSAQNQACIPILGQKWTKSYVGVYVAGGVSDIQRQQLLLSLNVWYSAQQWFIDSYEGGVSKPYLFYLTDSPGDGVITVSFLIGEGLSFAGRALNFAYTVPGNAYVRGDIQINLPPDRASNPNDLEVESIILHELGHGLGLGHSEIQSDAMYAIDNYPQSYGLPSTLDLYAVYMLKQAADPSALGGSICLQSQIPYGIPPWIQQNPTSTVISYPGGKFAGQYSYSLTGNPIVVGQSGTLRLTLGAVGDYPIRVVSLSARTASEQSLTPTESLPQELDPGSPQQFNFQLQQSDTNSVGTYSITFQLGFQLLTSAGWSSQTNYGTLTASYEVMSPATLTLTAPTAYCGASSCVVNGHTITFAQEIPPSPPLDVLWWLILGAILVLALIIGLKKASKSKEAKKD